ncbi:hypothetical protein ADK96_16030 [Streptomyces sp. IGB124]|nr:hypothetical protein ADK96_16030 [Streptomyces sp. IGB124]
MRSESLSRNCSTRATARVWRSSSANSWNCASIAVTCRPVAEMACSEDTEAAASWRAASSRRLPGTWSSWWSKRWGWVVSESTVAANALSPAGRGWVITTLYGSRRPTEAGAAATWVGRAPRFAASVLRRRSRSAW